jgi:hypothetical protein
MNFTSDWHSYTIPIWEAVVLPRLKGGPRRMLELGSYEGRSAAWALDNVVAAGELVCVDNWRVPDIEARFDQNVGSRVTKIKGHITSVLVGMADAGEKYDLIYIDGDHDGAAIIENAVLAWMLISAGGILVFDDYRYHNPQQFAVGKIDPHFGIDAFLTCYCLRMQVLHRAAQVIVAKV